MFGFILRLSLLQKFAGSSLIVLVAVGFFLAGHMASEIERATVADAGRQTSAYVQHLIVHQPQDSEVVLSLSRVREAEEDLRGRPLGEDLVRIKVWSPDGRIIYSSDERQIGRTYILNPELKAALSDPDNVHAELSSLSKSENLLEREGFARLLEVYVPIRQQDGSVVGVFEAYFSAERLVERVQESRIAIAVDLLGAFGALFAVLLLLFVRDVGRPLGALTAAAKRLSEGEFDTDIKARSEDEVGRLARAFQGMASSLKRRETELRENALQLGKKQEELNQQLSVRVEELAAINELGEAIFSRPETGEIPQRALEILAGKLGPCCGSVMLGSGGQPALVASFSLGEDHCRRLNGGEADAEQAVAEQAELRSNLVTIPDTSLRSVPDPVRKGASAHQYGALLAAPLIAKDRALGTIFLYFDEPQRWEESDLSFARLITNLAALAMDNASLIDRSQRRNRELAGLNSAAMDLNSSLDVEEILDVTVAAASESVVGQFAALYLLEGEGPTMQLRALSGLPPDHPQVASLAVEWMNKAEEIVAAKRQVTGILPAESSLRTYAGTPLIVKGEALGVLNVGRSGEKSFSQNELQLLTAVASHAAAAIENARLYDELERAFQRERHIAAVLQRSLLSEMPDISGADLGATYDSATSGARVGGDFWDVFPLRDGRMGVVIGDVCGKGVEAAVATSTVRHLLRNHAASKPSPASVLYHVNNELEGQFGPNEFVTAIYGIYDDNTGEFVYALAGHPPPIVVGGGARTGGARRLIGPPLAVLEGQQYHEGRIDLQPGGGLLLYTDGALEVRNEAGELMGEDRLRAAASEGGELSAPRLAEHIHQACIDFGRGRLVDDVAVLVIKRKRKAAA